MNSIRAVVVATLTLTGLTAAQATEESPAWRTDDFIMEEIVVTAVAPASYYMEEIVVTAIAPQIQITVAALELPEIVVTPVPVMEEIVVTAQREDLSSRLATRRQNMRDVRHF